MNKIKQKKDYVNEVSGCKIESKCKSQKYTYLRSVYYAICRITLPNNLNTSAKIGDEVNREHATVLHALKKTFYEAMEIPKYKKIYLGYFTKITLKQIIKHTNVDEKLKLKYKFYKAENKLLRLKLEPHEIDFRLLSEEKKDIYRLRVGPILKMILNIKYA